MKFFADGSEPQIGIRPEVLALEQELKTLERQRQLVPAAHVESIDERITSIRKQLGLPEAA